MKATGIIRRIDDLGRVVIPKEIRKELYLREGDPLEIFLDEEQGGIIFRPKSFEMTLEGGLKRIIRFYEEDSFLSNRQEEYDNAIIQIKQILENLKTKKKEG